MNAVFLNLISTDFFFFGHIASKLKTIPLAFISTLLHFVSLSAFLIGYAIWGICRIVYPNYEQSNTCDLITNPSSKQTQYPFFQLSDEIYTNIERIDYKFNFNLK